MWDMANFNRNNNTRGNRNFGKPRFNNDRPELYKATCASCGKDCEVPFKPTGSKPVYCRDCFKNNSNTDSHGSDNRSDRQMYDAVCSNCGNNCKIPFRPTQGRDILCSNCFEKNGPIDTRKPFEKHSFTGKEHVQKTFDVPNYKAQFDALNAKMDEILDILHKATAEAPAVEPAIEKKDEEVMEEKKKTVAKTPKKATKKTTKKAS
jgi:CxxC-x17-CxxC domain-containing protein